VLVSYPMRPVAPDRTHAGFGRATARRHPAAFGRQAQPTAACLVQLVVRQILERAFYIDSVDETDYTPAAELLILSADAV